MSFIPQEIQVYIIKKAVHLELFNYFEIKEQENKALKLKIQKLLKRIKYIRSVFFNLRHLLSKIISRQSRSKFGIELLRIRNCLNNINMEEQNNLSIHVFIIEDELNELIVSTINIYTITFLLFSLYIFITIFYFLFVNYWCYNSLKLQKVVF